MELHWGWAALAALALGAGLAWWAYPTDDSPASANADQGARHPHSGADADAGPTLYRWTDARGVVNITDRPPPGHRHYTIVHINPNRNIVPMGGSNSGSQATPPPR